MKNSEGFRGFSQKLNIFHSEIQKLYLMRNAAWISYSPVSATGLIPPIRRHLALPDFYTVVWCIKGLWTIPSFMVSLRRENRGEIRDNLGISGSQVLITVQKEQRCNTSVEGSFSWQKCKSHPRLDTVTWTNNVNLSLKAYGEIHSHPLR